MRRTRIGSKITVFALSMICVLTMATPARAFDSGSFGDTLADLWDKAKETGADVVDTVKENGPEWVETAKDKASTALDKGKEVVSDTQDKISAWNQQQQDEFWAREEWLLNGGAGSAKSPEEVLDPAESSGDVQTPTSAEEPSGGQALNPAGESDTGRFQATLPDGLDQPTDWDSVNKDTISDPLLERLETGFYEVDNIYYYFDSEAGTWSQVTFEDPSNPSQTTPETDPPAVNDNAAASINDGATKADGNDLVETAQQDSPEEEGEMSLGKLVMYGIITLAVVVIAGGWCAFVIHQIRKEKDEEDFDDELEEGF